MRYGRRKSSLARSCSAGAVSGSFSCEPDGCTLPAVDHATDCAGIALQHRGVSRAMLDLEYMLDRCIGLSFYNILVFISPIGGLFSSPWSCCARFGTRHHSNGMRRTLWIDESSV